MYRLPRVALALPCAAALAFASPSAAQDRTYNAPRFGEERLDWCMRIGRECGEPVALEFCRRRRYEGVRLFRAYRVGRTDATRTIGSNETCSDDEGCTGFAYVVCTGRIPPGRVFANPVWGKRRLDWCLRWGTECGTPAADAFCRAQGFVAALHALPDEAPGNSSTRVIGDGRLCDGPRCRGFQQIICR